MSSARPLNRKPAIRAAVWDACKGKCHHCGCDLSVQGFHLDHLVPLHVGGPDELENLVGSCPSCNSHRANDLIRELKQRARENGDAVEAGLRLRSERRRLGLNQKQLAAALGVRQSTISEWEKGKVTIRHEHILELAMRDIARSLGVEPKELLRDE